MTPIVQSNNSQKGSEGKGRVGGSEWDCCMVGNNPPSLGAVMPYHSPRSRGVHLLQIILASILWGGSPENPL
ncbi:3200_t:CDS:2 [Diversispora eburnea]|uniref:3200_t:CDS:1 n=1 Tax=Diversispora eburnea TaxID=1213867 RepID=A0A9N8Z0X3_9GLOM|nr:3200_t:CDS:2 [Diversispora eburnea]